MNITDIIISKELELTAKGYSPEQTDAAIRRARRYAEKMSKAIRPENRESAFVDFFLKELTSSEKYLDGMTKALTA